MTESAKQGPGYKKLVIIVVGIWIGVALGVLLLWALSASGRIALGLPGSSSVGQAQSVAGDQPAPGFVLENLAGDQITLDQYAGKVVVLNYWATWCGPCIREIPMFQQYHQAYSPDLVILGINAQEQPQEVKEFLEQIEVSYEILLDTTGKVLRGYKVIVLPATVFIDEKGILRYQHIGFMSEEQFAGYLREMGVLE